METTKHKRRQSKAALLQALLDLTDAEFETARARMWKLYTWGQAGPEYHKRVVSVFCNAGMIRRGDCHRYGRARDYFGGKRYAGSKWQKEAAAE